MTGCFTRKIRAHGMFGGAAHPCRAKAIRCTGEGINKLLWPPASVRIPRPIRGFPDWFSFALAVAFFLERGNLRESHMQARPSRFSPVPSAPSSRHRNSPARRPLTASLGKYASALALSAALAAGTAISRGATFYWDSDQNAAGNSVTGAGLGGMGTWDTASPRWWNGVSADVAWPNTAADIAIFTGVPGVVTLSGTLTADTVDFRTSAYRLTGGTLNLSGGNLRASFTESATIESVISGSAGLTMNGGGGIRLSGSNTYTGTTTISDGTVIIGSQSALGLSTSAIQVTGSNVRGFGGGSLVLDGDYGTGVTISRNIDITGLGPISDRGAALISVRHNTITGAFGRSLNPLNFDTRALAVGGFLSFVGGVNVPGTIAADFLTLGGVNAVGSSGYNLTGALSGSGTLEKTSAGTLILNPNNSNLFTGTIRVSGGGSVRLVSPSVLGTRAATTTGSVLDLNGGLLEVRMDAPSVTAGGNPANVYQRGTNSSFFVDHAVTGSAVNGTATFGAFTFDDGQTTVFNGRNGYSVTFSTARVNVGDGNTTFNNNLNGRLTINGDFWNNTNNAANRTMTVGGNGDTFLNGNLLASAAARNHNFTKNGTGTFSISSTGATLDGTVTVNGGTLAFNDFRSINNNTATLNLGATTIAGALNINGTAPTAAGLTTSKVINLASTTGNVVISANQTGIDPVVFNSDINATGGGAKTLYLGGINTADNRIAGVIENNSAGNPTSLSKIGTGTWVLSGNNTFSGSTTIAGGRLRVSASVAAANILPSAGTNTVVFGVDPYSQSAGGTLEFLGVNNVATTETLGALTPTSGGSVIQLTPGGTGSVTLTFSSLGTRTAGATVDLEVPATSSVRFTAAPAGTNGILGGYATFGGVDWVTSGATAGRFTAYNTTLPGTGSSATTNYHVAGSTVTVTANESINSLKLSGAASLTVNAVLTIGTGGVLFDNSSSPVTIGGSSQVGANATEVIITTNGSTPANALTINSRISGTTGQLTKAGNGLLVLGGPNSFTGNVHINGGTVRLTGPTATIGTGQVAGTVMNLRQGGTFDLDGAGAATTLYVGGPSVAAVQIGTLVGAGTVTDSGNLLTTPSALIIGNGTTTTASGLFTGLLQDGLGRLNVVKRGTGTLSLMGTNTYTGATVLTNGTLAVTNLANIGAPSAIGSGDILNNAGSLVFNGGVLLYTGTTGTISQAMNTPSITTDRLFTLAGNGTIDSQGSFGSAAFGRSNNNAALVFSNTGTVAYAGTGSRSLTLQGDSTGGNRVNLQLVDPSGAQLSIAKSGNGLWVLGNSTNTFTGTTTINAGALRANTGQSLPNASNLVLAGGVLETSGLLTRTLGTGAGQFTWTNGGFAATDSKLTVNFGGAAPVWNSTPNFVIGSMTLGSNTSLAEVEIQSGFQITQGIATSLNLTTTANSATVNLASGTTAGLAIGQEIEASGNIPAGRTIASIQSDTRFTLNSGTGVTAGSGTATSIIPGGYREIIANINTTSNTDFSTISGVITGDGTLRKSGAGILQLLAANTYTGGTQVTAGILVTNLLGSSTATAGGTSLGTNIAANTAAQALTLGNGGTGAATLQYLGAGETSDRMIRLNTTTGNTQIHADGTGPLILTNVVNDVVDGNKTLFLRGSNAQGNRITSVLADRGGTLGVTIDGGATWILTANNTLSGAVTVGAGALGLGADTVIGNGRLVTASGSVFAYGGDRVISNLVQQANNSTTAFIGDRSVTFTNTFELLAAANNVGTTNNISGGLLTFGNVTADLMTAARTWTINGTGNTVITGAISNAVEDLNVTFSPTNPASTLTLRGMSTYTGGTNLQAGTTILASGTNNHLPATSTITLGNANNSGVLQIGDAGGSVTATIGSVAVAGTGNANAIVGGNSLPTPSVIRVNPTVDFTMPVSIGGTTSDPILNNLKLVKVGAGTLTLTRTNFYTGGTEIGTLNGVNGGTLALSGSIATLGDLNALRPLTVFGGTFNTGTSAPEVTNLLLGGGAASSTARVVIGGDLFVKGDIVYNAANNPNPAVISGVGGLNFTPAAVGTQTNIIVGSSQAGSGGALAPDLTISAALIGSSATGGGSDSDIRKMGPGSLRLVGNGATTYQGRVFVDSVP